MYLGLWKLLTRAPLDISGTSSEGKSGKCRLTAAWQLPQHLLWGAKPDL